MSQIKILEIKTANNKAVDVDFLLKGIAKFACQSEPVNTLNFSYAIDSITDHALGVLSHNFSVSIISPGWVGSVTGDPSTSWNDRAVSLKDLDLLSTANCSFREANANQDPADYSFEIFGDLA